MRRYCETGHTNTPHCGSTPTGRGQRKMKKNQRFLDSDAEEEPILKEKVLFGVCKLYSGFCMLWFFVCL